MQRKGGGVAFVVMRFAAGGRGCGLWHRDRIVAAYKGAIMGSKAQEGCYAHHGQQMENRAPRPDGIAAVIYIDDGLLGGGRRKQ